ncbi:MAG TPA: 50S ribosomal protein L35 [Chloroflexi bacterium]|nr:50S ribosomal protein L35 [Chloroflexota bacterium]
MPKLKTHKATAKRFKLTGSGKLMRTKGEKRHLRRKRSKRAKRSAWKMLEVETPGENQRIKRLLPYISKYKG